MHARIHVPQCLHYEENHFHHSYFYSQTTTKKLSQWFPSQYGLWLQWQTMPRALLKYIPLCQHHRTELPVVGVSAEPVPSQPPFAALCPPQPLFSNEVNSGVIETWGNGTAFQLEGTRLLQFYQLPAAEKTRVPAALSKPMFNSQESSSKYQLAHGLQIPATCTYAKRAQTICDKNTRRIQCTNHHQAMLAHFYVLNRCFQLTLNKKTHTEWACHIPGKAQSTGHRATGNISKSPRFFIPNPKHTAPSQQCLPSLATSIYSSKALTLLPTCSIPAGAPDHGWDSGQPEPVGGSQPTASWAGCEVRSNPTILWYQLHTAPWHIAAEEAY